MERLTNDEINERPATIEERLLIGSKAIEQYIIPIDPMDELQCDSCQ